MDFQLLYRMNMKILSPDIFIPDYPYGYPGKSFLRYDRTLLNPVIIRAFTKSIISEPTIETTKKALGA